IGTSHADQHVILLDADFEVTLGEIFRHRAAAGELDLGLHLITDAELVDDLLGIRAATAARPAHRFAIEHAALEGLDRADVRLRCAGLYGDAERGGRERHRRVGYDLAELHQ